MFTIYDNSTTNGSTSNMYFPLVTQGMMVSTPSGTVIKATDEEIKGTRRVDATGKPLPTPKKGVPSALYFRYVKSRLTVSEVKELRPRVNRLRGLAEDALAVGQTGLYEMLLKQLAVTIREIECDVAGYGKWVTRADVNKFKDKVENRVVEFCPLSNFPRVLPKFVQEKLAAVQEKKLFDEFHILHTNLTKEPKVLTAAEVIAKKDPILFGAFAYDTERLFYICDWIDEYCDLTLDSFITTVKKVDPAWKPSQVRDPTEEEIKAILDEVKNRFEREKKTTSSSWRRDVEEEQVSRTALLPPAPLVAAEAAASEVRKPWWKRWFS